MFENPLAGIRDEVAKFPELKQPKAGWMASVKAFRDRIGRALQIIREEPEILAFAAAQWLVVLLGFVVWCLILFLLPEDGGRSAEPVSMTYGVGYVITALAIASLWTLAVIVCVSLPVGVLSAAMGAAHLLRRSGEVSTPSRCLAIAWSNMRALWVYHAIDGYVTINAVLARLPKKNRNRSKLEMVTEELLYFAWKLACVGVLPAMICGHGLLESGKRSLGFVKAKLAPLMVLRAGYGGMCWAIGAGAYVCGMAMIFDVAPTLITWAGITSTWALVFITIGMPTIFALALVQVVLQPVYILTVCDLYADHLADTRERLSLAGDMQPTSRPLDIGVAGYAIIAALAALAAWHFGMAELLSDFARGSA